MTARLHEPVRSVLCDGSLQGSPFSCMQGQKMSFLDFFNVAFI